MKNKIVIIGMPGCGKTTISKILEKELNFKLYDVDEYIQDKTSKTISELFEKGEDYFRDIETEACIDLSKKKTVEVRYHIGFERVVREAVGQFAAMGLKTVLFRAAVSAANKRQHLKNGYYGAYANRQYEYDHRYDNQR